MDSNRRGRPSLRKFGVEAAAFLHEIVRVAECLREAKAFDGDSAMHLGPLRRLLAAIDRCEGAPTLADLGRLLDMSRQGAREQAIEAAQSGLVELFQNPRDRRAWQVVLTPAGRRALEARRMPNPVWLFTLLNGLEPAEMRRTHGVLSGIRLRLERYESERRRALSAASGRR